MKFKLLKVIEKYILQLQGKGWNNNTIKQEVKFAATFLKRPTCIVDIGGNVGKYSMEIRKKFPEVYIHIFEPAKVNIEVLENKFKEDLFVKINKFALSDRESKMNLYTNIPGSGLASLTKRDLNHFNINFDISEEVSVIRFEDYWKNSLSKASIDFVKIDVEGHELNVLQGFGDAINFVKILQFEFGGCNIDTRTFFHDFYLFFNEKKFNIYRITPIGLELIEKYSEFDETFITTNFLCVKQ